MKALNYKIRRNKIAQTVAWMLLLLLLTSFSTFYICEGQVQSIAKEKDKLNKEVEKHSDFQKELELKQQVQSGFAKTDSLVEDLNATYSLLYEELTKEINDPSSIQLKILAKQDSISNHLAALKDTVKTSVFKAVYLGQIQKYEHIGLLNKRLCALNTGGIQSTNCENELETKKLEIDDFRMKMIEWKGALTRKDIKIASIEAQLASYSDPSDCSEVTTKMQELLDRVQNEAEHWEKLYWAIHEQLNGNQVLLKELEIVFAEDCDEKPLTKGRLKCRTQQIKAALEILKNIPKTTTLST